MIRHSPTRALATAVLVCLLVAGGVGGVLFLQPASAQDDSSIEITRENNDLVISVSTNYQRGTVWINETEQDTKKVETVELVENKTMIPLQSLTDDPNVNLTRAHVKVKIVRGTTDSGQADQNSGPLTENKTMDLRTIEFGEEIAVDSGTLRVPVENLSGVGNEIPLVLVDSNGTEFQFSRGATESEDRGISVPLSHAVQNGTNVYGDLTLRAFSDSPASTASDIPALADHFDPPEVVAADGTLQLESDLVFANETYRLEGVGDTPTLTLESTKSGVLDLEDIEKLPQWYNESVSLVHSGSGETIGQVQIPFDNETVFDVTKNAVAAPTIQSGELTHPLLFNDEEYLLVVETKNPAGTYTVRETATQGSISLPEEQDQLYAAETATVTVVWTDSGLKQVTEQSWERDGTVDINGQIERDTLILNSSNMDDSSWVSSLDNSNRVWLRSGGLVSTVEREDIEQNSSQVTITGINPVFDANETVTVVAFDENNRTIERLNVSLSASGGGDDGTSPSGQTSNLNLVLGVITLVMIGVTGSSYVAGFPVVQSAPQLSRVGLGILTHALVLVTLVVADRPIQIGPEFALSLVFGVGSGLLLILHLKSNREDTLLGLIVWTTLFAVAGSALWYFEMISISVMEFVIGGIYGLVAGITLLVLAIPQTSAPRTPQSIDTTIKLVDAVTGDPIGTATEVTYRLPGEKNDQITIEGGQKTVSLTTEEWEFTARKEGIEEKKKLQLSQYQNTVTLRFSGRPLTTYVRTGDRGETTTVPNADVSVESGAFVDHGVTDQQGRYRTKVPVDISQVEITAEHDRCEPQTRTVTLSEGSHEEVLTLPLKTGDVLATVTLDGNPVSGVEVRSEARNRSEQYTAQTDNRGRANFTDILIGEYDVDVTLPVSSPAYEVSGERITVRENQTAQSRIAVRFEYQLTREQQDRIRTLRRRLDDIGTSSRRDDAIQSYYASALSAVLDEIESIPQSGHLFFRHNEDPNEVADALLETAEKATTLLDSVVSSQRNVDLFSACSGLPQASVDWRGELSLSDLLELSQNSMAQQESRANDELEAVEERITGERRELAEVSPAQEMLEEVQTLIRDQRGNSDARHVTAIFVSLVLLDAIESLFDQRELRKRLEQTVY